MNAQTVLASTGGLPPFEFKLPCDSRPENETTVQSTLELGSPIPDYFSQIDVHGNFIDASLAEFTRSEDDFFGIYHFDFKDFDSDSFTSPHKESFKDDPSDKIEAIAAPNCSGDDPQFLEAESLNPNQAKNNTLPKNPKTSATKKKQISNAAKSLLNNYFAKAFYPKDDQIEALVEQTDLTKKQVKTWFTNKRSRTKTEGVVEPFLFLSERQLGSGASPPKHCVLTSADPITLSRKSLEKLNESYKKPEQPIAVSRFLQSPPDGSAVNSEKLEEAAKGLPGLPVESLTDRSCGTLSLPWSGDLSGDLYHHTSMQMLTNWNDPISIPTAREEDARSISSSSPQNLRYSPYAHSSRAASVRSGASVASMWSSGSVKSWSSRISRKGRRRSAWGSLVDNDDQSLRPLVLVDEPKLKEISKARPFICTFDCGKAFASLSDWKRHEKAVHMPQDQWICNHPDVKMLPEVCPYDNSEFPSPSHMHAHQHDSCVYKRTEDRTFQRKDNLLQHLRIVHRVEDTTAMTKTIEAWRLPAQSLSPHDPALHCGFCGTVLPSWHDRVAHVGAHLKKGQKLTDWWEQRLDSTLDFAKMLIVPRVFRAISSRGVNCVACGEVFSNLCAAKKEHAQCQVYSCRNFTAVDTKMRHGVCSYCATDLFGDSRGILPHLHQSHKFRGCKQLLFFSKEKFHKHLRHVHDVPESKVQAMGSVCSASFNTHFAPIFSDPIKLTCNGMDGRHVGVERDDCECEHSANDDTKTSEQF